jgi:hypothetical protein
MFCGRFRWPRKDSAPARNQDSYSLWARTTEIRRSGRAALARSVKLRPDFRRTVIINGMRQGKYCLVNWTDRTKTV